MNDVKILMMAITLEMLLPQTPAQEYIDSHETILSEVFSKYTVPVASTYTHDMQLFNIHKTIKTKCRTDELPKKRSRTKLYTYTLVIIS
jgi:hypothetical protein